MNIKQSTIQELKNQICDSCGWKNALNSKLWCNRRSNQPEGNYCNNWIETINIKDDIKDIITNRQLKEMDDIIEGIYYENKQ